MAAHHLGSSAPPSIPGIQIGQEDGVDQLKHDVAGLLERDSPRFPGAQPVSFARQHIAELQRREYFMCEKTDGIRCLLYLTFKDVNGDFLPATILIDRKNNYYDVQPPLRFPYYKDYKDPLPFLYGTILDGELVNDAMPDGSRQLIFYIFDCLAVDSDNMCARTLDKRLGYMKQRLIEPWKKYLAWTKSSPPTAPFIVKEKAFHSPYHVTNMFQNVLPNLKHGNDGLIFTCKSTRYVHGTDNAILKWKPPHENTIDFRLRLGDFPTTDPEDGEGGPTPDYDAMPTSFTLLVNHGKNDYRPFADLAVTPDEWTMFKSLNQRLDGRIIECYRLPSGQWKFKKDDDGTPRWRDDKSDANHISTVNSVIESIEDPVTEADLRNAEARIRDAVYKLRKEEQQGQGQGQGQGHAQQAQHADAESAAKKRKFSEANGGA